MKKRKRNDLWGFIKNKYYAIISSGVATQLLCVFILFIAVFFLIKGIYGLDSDVLFKEMTNYEPKEASSPTRPLKIIYLIGVVFFSGLLVMVLTNGIRNRIDRIVSGDVRYSFRNHIVVFGYNEIAKGVIKNICAKKKHPPIVLIVENNLARIREELVGLYGAKSEIYLQLGSRNRVDDLRSFKLNFAHEIFIIGENEPMADSMNMECYRLISQMEKFSSWEAYLYLYLNEPASVSLLSNRSYAATVENILDLNHKLRVYNVEERWARRILVDSMNAWPDSNLNMRGEKRLTMDSSLRIHLVIFGMSNAGEMIAKTAAQTCHHPNYVTKGIRTRITVIDESFENHRGILHGRYSDYMKLCHYSVRRIKDGKSEEIFVNIPPEEYDYLDTEWDFIESIPDDITLQKELADWCENENDLMTVVVCNCDEKSNMSIAMGLPKNYYDNEIPIWLYSKSDYSIEHYLKLTRYGNIVLWGMQSNRPTEELWEEVAAKQLNYWNEHFDRFMEHGFEKDPVDKNEIEEAWRNAPINTRMDCIAVMSAVPSIVGSMRDWYPGVPDLHLDDYELKVFSELEHIRWSTCKLIEGYRPSTIEQTMQVVSDNSEKTWQMRKHLQKKFVAPYISKYELVERKTRSYDSEMIRFYISIINN